MAPDKKMALRKELDDLLQRGIIEPSNSPWSSPVHLVKKDSGKYRVTGDYRKLNFISKVDKYSLPHIRSFNDNLADCKIFSKIDLKDAFLLIRVFEPHQEKTTIATCFGNFFYKRMNFGMRNASATFQRFINHILRKLDFAFGFLDDIIIASKDEMQHLEHLKTLFACLATHGLKINIAKCEFGKDSLIFLGHKVCKDGIFPTEDKIKAIKEFPLPINQKKLREYLGLINFYRRFIPNCSTLLQALTKQVTSTKKNCKDPIVWNEFLINCFEKSKNALANVCKLVHPDGVSPVRVQVDASISNVGSVLEIFRDNEWLPLGIFF